MIYKLIKKISMEPIYVGDLIPSIYSYQKVIDSYEKALKKGEFYEAVSYTHLTLPTTPYV